MTQEPIKLSQQAGGLRCAAVSDIGMRRATNQDSMTTAVALDSKLWASRGHLFVVADGMGAHAAGELASQMAVENIPHAYHKRRDLSPGNALTAAVHDANLRIFSKGQNSVDFQGMGTTCSCLTLLPTGAVVVHVGDSRVYRWRDDAFEQLTFDHSLVWEMAAAGQANEEDVPAYVPKNVITRSLGPNSIVKTDIEGPLALQSGDRFLLCSDGLTGPLNPQLIGLITGVLSPEDATQTLVDLANLLGGPDNITVIIAEVTNLAELGSPEDTGPNCKPTLTPRHESTISPLFLFSSALGGALLATPLWLYGYQLAAGVVAVLSGLTCMLHAFFSRALPSTDLPPAQGEGPYRHYVVSPSAASVEPLSNIVTQLEDLESQRDWQFDWAEIHAVRSQAQTAIAGGNYHEAVVAYSKAVRLLMAAVRKASPEPPSDSSINLGAE